MNEQHFSLQLRHALDESTDRLPYKVTHRLSNARELALARMAAEPVGFAALQPSAAADGAATVVRNSGGGTWWRLTGTVLPVLILAAGIVFMSSWDLFAKAEELAEVEAAMIEDDVPLDAYADRGFGVFLKNSRQ